MARPIVEELSVDECTRLLGLVSVGRVGVTIDALPAVLPVNYVLHDGAIVFRTVPGTKLDAATANMVVAFEVDRYGDPGHRHGWSVLVRGIAREITDTSEVEAARALPLESWAYDGHADRFVRIESVTITGRRITPG